jgi:hypothetical protein
VNTVKPRKKQRRKAIREAAPADAKEVDNLKRELAAQRKAINTLERSNKYLRDRLSNVEYRVSVADRILTNLQNAVNKFSRIIR